MIKGLPAVCEQSFTIHVYKISETCKRLVGFEKAPFKREYNTIGSQPNNESCHNVCMQVV